MLFNFFDPTRMNAIKYNIRYFNDIFKPEYLPIDRVMMQIVQELCKRPGLNKTGFDMPTIYVPNPNKV